MKTEIMIIKTGKTSFRYKIKAIEGVFAELTGMMFNTNHGAVTKHCDKLVEKFAERYYADARTGNYLRRSIKGLFKPESNFP